MAPADPSAPSSTPPRALALSGALRARLHTEAPHLLTTTREALITAHADVVAPSSLPHIDAPAPAPDPAAVPTLWRQIPRDDPDGFIDSQLRAAVVTLMARGLSTGVDTAGTTSPVLTRETLRQTIAHHLDVDDDLAGAVADELHTMLANDPALRAELERASQTPASTLSPVKRATVATIARPGSGAGPRGGQND